MRWVKRTMMCGCMLLAVGCSPEEKPFSMYSMECEIILNSTYAAPAEEWLRFHLYVHGSGIDALRKPIMGDKEIREGKCVFELSVENLGKKDVQYYFPANQKPYFIGTFKGGAKDSLMSEEWTRPRTLGQGKTDTLVFEKDFLFVLQKPIPSGRGENGAFVFVVCVEGKLYPVLATVSLTPEDPVWEQIKETWDGWERQRAKN